MNYDGFNFFGEYEREDDPYSEVVRENIAAVMEDNQRIDEERNDEVEGGGSDDE